MHAFQGYNKVTMFHDGEFCSIGRCVPFKEDQPEWLCPNFSLDKFSFSDFPRKSLAVIFKR